MKEASKQDYDESAVTYSSFCEKMKRKLHQLANVGKLSLSEDNNREKAGQNVLDLGKGSFSAGCRKVTGIYMYKSS